MTEQEREDRKTRNRAETPRHGAAMRICCELQVKYFASPEAHQAQEYARQSGWRVHAWKTSGDSDWLESGTGHGDVRCLLVLPQSLPDIIALQEDTHSNAFHCDRDYPYIFALIEGMLHDINSGLRRCGIPLELPTLFRPGARFAQHPKRSSLEQTDWVEKLLQPEILSWRENRK